MRLRGSLFLLAPSLVLAACNTGPKDPAPSVHPEPKTLTSATATSEAKTDGVLRLGAPIEGAAAAQKTTLAEVAKNPSAFVGKSFTTTGTVTAVCQHMGCWMEIKDDASEAHIKMAGHAFFVPKTASGRKARVLATLVKNENEGACADEGEGKMAALGGGDGKGEKKKGGCRAEAEAQLGRPLAKLELVAQGVELL
jgi:hypothetical protein